MGGEEKISLPLSILSHLIFHGSAIQLVTATTDSLAEQEKNLSQARCNGVLREAPGLPSCRRRRLPSRLSAVSPYPIWRNCLSSWHRSAPEGPHLSDDVHHGVNFGKVFLHSFFHELGQKNCIDLSFSLKIRIGSNSWTAPSMEENFFFGFLGWKL